MMAQVEVGPSGVAEARFRFVRHNAANETVLCALADEGATFDRLAGEERARSARNPHRRSGDWVRTRGYSASRRSRSAVSSRSSAAGPVWRTVPFSST